MGRWILVEVCDREISYPCSFNNKEDAVKEMHKRLAQVLEIDIKEVSESYYSGEMINNDACALDRQAYCEKHHALWDWQIFYV